MAFGQVAQHALFQFRPIREVLRSQDVPLEGGEDQLHLIQPRGVDGQPMAADCEREAEAPNPGLDLLGGVGRPAVQDQVHEANLMTPEAAKEHPAELLEVHETLALKTPRQRLALMHQQGGEEIENPVPFVAGSNPQGLASAGRQDAPGYLQGLEAGLLSRADDDDAMLDEGVGLFVEPQHGRGLLQEAGIGGLLPRTGLPGLDVVRA